jgi:hypothetical protein
MILLIIRILKLKQYTLLINTCKIFTTGIMYNKSFLLGFSVFISAVLMNLMVNQKPSFADESYDINLMKKYVQTYKIGVQCGIENPQYSSCIILKNGALKMINDLLIEVDEKAIKTSVNYCRESSDLYNLVRERDIPIGTLRYTWMKNYCNQNGQQFV